MQLSERFLTLVKQQLASFEGEAAIKHLAVYVAQSRDGESPSLEAVGQWPSLVKVLPPVESDSELRAPSPDRRWYPLQEGSILLGVLRAERVPSDQVWPDFLDQRLQATAAALAHCLGLEIDRGRILDELSQQREQIGLMVHQLRNPLAALRTYAQLLLRRLGPESKHATLVEGLLSEQAQLNRYISALDQISQVQLPSYRDSSAPLLLPPVLSTKSDLNIRLLIEPLIDRASATANLQGRKWFGPKEWPVWTENLIDSEYGVIAEIVANLLENAFRYSASTTSIGLYINDQGLCIWDEGVPINCEEREKIFQRGYRGRKNLEVSVGSGLGLPFGRQLAEKLGGSLELITPPRKFDSSLPNIGNAFVLSLQTKELSEEEA